MWLPSKNAEREVTGPQKLYQGTCFPRKGYNEKVPTYSTVIYSHTTKG